jgi:hypothetical protein
MMAISSVPNDTNVLRRVFRCQDKNRNPKDVGTKLRKRRQEGADVMNSKQHKWIVTERGRLEEKGYRILTAESMTDGLIVQVNFEHGTSPIQVGTVTCDNDAIAWRDALALAVQHSTGARG